MIRLFIVADSAVARSSLEELFQNDARVTVLGSSSTAASVNSYSSNHADVLVVEGIKGLVTLNHYGPDASPAIVLLADELTRAEVRVALQNGVRAILARESRAEEVFAATIAVSEGLVVLGSEQMDALLPARRDNSDANPTFLEPLTSREMEVLDLLAQGAGNKKIADRLNLSEHTVKFHVSAILGKLGAATRTEAVSAAIRRGLIVV